MRRGAAGWTGLVATGLATMAATAATATAQLPGVAVPSGPLPGIDPVGLTAPQPVRAEPPVVAAPRAACPPEARPEPGVQGRTPDGGAGGGYRCNLDLIGREGSTGGYKVLRYVDAAGRECAYYDSTLAFPVNAAAPGLQPTLGVVVLDMADPARPRRTATLRTPAMLSPHESLELNERRGLLVAVMGSPVFQVGQLDVYDLRADCRHPVLRSSTPVGVLGHESGFAPDGRTFYATSIGGGLITAIGLDDPSVPVPLWVGHVNAHGLNLSDDGRRAYVAARQGLLVLDVSEIQDRRPLPRVRLVGGLSWRTQTTPQTAIPVTIGGRPYAIEVDEFAQDSEDPPGASTTRQARNGLRVGAARIIDLADERAPRVVSNLRLAVHQPELRAAHANDPGASNTLQGYAMHFCHVPRRREPGIVACSSILSGLRVFDVRDPLHPREVAYYVAPAGRLTGVSPPSNWAMARPAFVPERREVWYADANSGFLALRLDPALWP